MIANGTHVLADLDSLFDSRLGTIALFDPKTAIQVLRKPEYVLRLHDSFDNMIDHEDWNQEDYDLNYEHRNIATLSYSKITSMVLGIRKMFIELYAELGNDPEHENIEFIVNLWPYKDLTEDEKTDIIASLHEFIPDYVKIKTVYLDLKKLTPSYMKNRFTHWFTYHFNDWTAAHLSKDLSPEELVEMQNPHLKIIAPLLLKDKESEEEYRKYMAETRNKEDIIKNPFLLAMVSLSDMFELIFQPVEDYCCILR